MRKDKEYNNHHWCPESRRGASNSLNVEMIKKTTHTAIHTLFANEIYPEQIERLTTLTSRVLLPEVVSEIMEVLNSRDIHDPTQWYKDEVLWLPKRFRK